MTLPIQPTKSQLCFKKQDDTSREPIREQLCFKKQDDSQYVSYVRDLGFLEHGINSIDTFECDEYMLPLLEIML